MLWQEDSALFVEGRPAAPSFSSRAYTATPAGSQGLPNGPTPQGWRGAGRQTHTLAVSTSPLPRPAGPQPSVGDRYDLTLRRWLFFLLQTRLTCVTSRVDGGRPGCIRGTSRAGSQLGRERGHLGDRPRGRMSGGGDRRCSCEPWGRRERGEHSSHPRCKEPRLLQAMSSLMGRPDRTFRDQQVKGSMSQVHHG